MKTALTLLAAALLLSPSVAGATGSILDIITDADTRRLERFDEAKAAALAEARAGGSSQDLATLEEIVGRAHLPWSGFDMTGQWKCRTIKVGGIATLVVYGWFACRVSDDGSGWRLEKLTGSQRTTGRFFDEDETTLTYLGAYHVAGDPVPDYGTGPHADQVGRAFRSGNQGWHIEFPLPTYESRFDILEFRR